MTKSYTVVLKKSVLKDIRRIPLYILRRIQDRITTLVNNPFPSDVEPLEGHDHYYRMRMGDYRIVYEVAATIRIITIIRIGHRKEVYRNM